MLKVAGRPQVDLREGQQRGRRLRVEWVLIEEPDPDVTSFSDPNSTFNQGWNAGGAKFNRLEGCWKAATARSSSSPPAAATRRTATSTPTATRRASARSWRTAGARPARRGRADARLRVAVRRGVRRAGQHDGHAARRALPCEDDPSTAFVDTHPLAPGIENINQVIGVTRRATRSSSRSTCSTAPSWRGCRLQPERGDAVRPVSDQARFDEDGRGDDLRGHGAVAPRPVVDPLESAHRPRAGAQADVEGEQGAGEHQLGRCGG